MKKVVHLVIDKNGAETIEFNPTKAMLAFGMMKAKHLDKSDTEIASLVYLSPDNPRKWATKYGSLYLEWLEEFVEQCAPENDAGILEMVGMLNAKEGNYSFWRDMARKHGVIKDEAKENKITINTDFSMILLGRSPEAARDAILQEVMGIKNTVPLVLEAKAVVIGGDEKERAQGPLQEEAGQEQIRPDREGEGRPPERLPAHPIPRKRQGQKTV